MPGNAAYLGTTRVEDSRLAEHVLQAIADKVAWKLRTMYPHTSTPVDPLPDHASAAPGIHVLSAPEVARVLGKSERHLLRLEHNGEIPCRRRISRRRTGYLAHELQGLGADRVMARDPRRTLSRKQVAEKLGMNEKTVWRMVRCSEMPAPVAGRWLEREIDAWLLERPRIRS